MHSLFSDELKTVLFKTELQQAFKVRLSFSVSVSFRHNLSWRSHYRFILSEYCLSAWSLELSELHSNFNLVMTHRGLLRWKTGSLIFAWCQNIDF